MMLFRHLLAILLLPTVVVVGVPRWLLPAGPRPWPATVLEHALAYDGAAVFLAGFLLFAWCVALFARRGRGTLAPWDPTKALVTTGPYAWVRNPMISGVAFMLAGETLYFGEPRLAYWTLLFVVVNHVYFRHVEEPGLARRFGAAWAEYAARVPRWLPKRPRRAPLTG